MKHLFLASTVEWPGVAKSIYRNLNIKSPRIPFITTPDEVIEEDMSWLEDERKMLRQAGFDLFDYTITDKSLVMIRKDLSNIDALYISGGNEFYFKHQCNVTGFGQFIQEWVNTGKPYLGSSAGSMILAPDMSPATYITDTNIPNMKIADYTGLNLVDFLIMPHWGSAAFRDVYLGERKSRIYEADHRLILLNNYQYIEVVDGKYRIIDVRSEP